MNPQTKSDLERPVRILYSFPHKLGASRICTTAWHQVEGLSQAGAKVKVFTGSICRAMPEDVVVHTTLSYRKLRLPYRILGSRRASALHDWIVARVLKRFKTNIDLVHVWPLGALRTIAMAKRLGIPTFLERPNAHTGFAYEVVQKECRKIGVSMPKGHEHDYDPKILAREEAEYQLTDFLLCPSDFVARTFHEKGFCKTKLLRHQYGFDNKLFYPRPESPGNGELKVLFAGGCAPRKGLHYALEAWLGSGAFSAGTFFIAGSFIPGYAERLQPMLSHPSVKILGHRNDLPEVMRSCDILILPSIEEGSALVTSEARGSGCVLLVSDAAGAPCSHMENGLVHAAGDVATLQAHLTALSADRPLLSRLREKSIRGINEITWEAAGRKLLALYRDKTSCY